jgi:hypothetical protein
MLTECLCSAIAFGASQIAFNLSNAMINTLVIDPEVLLIFLGVFNKILDYLVDNAISHICDTKLTDWMLQDPQRSTTAGVTANDFKLKQEMTLPWVPLWYVPRQVRSWKKTTWWALLRTLCTLATSICVLLLGAGINTVGIPKSRWYPAGWAPDYLAASKVVSSRRALQSVNWMTYWNEAWRSIGSGPTSWAVANALSSSTLFTALSQVSYMYTQEPSGWHLDYNNLLTFTALDTRVSENTVQSISVLGDACFADIYLELKESGSKWARKSNGIDGTANMTLPFLTTTCVDTQRSTADLLVSVSDSKQLQVFLPSWSDDSSLECILEYQQTLFPVHFWLGGTTDDGIYHVINPSPLSSPIPLPKVPADEAIIQTLQTQITGMKPYLDGLSPNGSFLQYMRLVSQNLQATTPNLTSSSAAMMSVVAFTFQHLLTMGDWNITHSAFQVSHNFSFWVYGSGPRMGWEWAAVLILIVPMMVCCYDVYLILAKRTTRGPWLDVQGMMLTANASEEFSPGVKNCAGLARSEDTKFVVREVGASGMQIAEVGGKGYVLQLGRAYGD